MMESSVGDSCAVIMDMLSSDLSASLQNKKPQQDKKQKQLRRDTPLRNVDVTRLNQYIRVVAFSYNGAVVARRSHRNAVVKTLTSDYWFRLNQPVSVMTLVAESNESSEFVSRLLRRGVVLGRYVRSGTDYLPSFELANDMSVWYQRADIPFILRPNQFLIKSELPSWQFAKDFLLLTGVHASGVSAAGSVLMIWIIALEIMHGEPVTATILSEKTGLSKSTVSDTIDHLIGAGYLMRQLDRFDERSSMLSLTLSDEHRVAVQALFATYFLM